MKMRFVLTTLTAVVVCCALDIQAQGGEKAAGHEALAMLVGVWTIEGKEDRFADTCAWYPGGYFVVCNSGFQSSSGLRQGVSVFGYTAESDTYTYYHYGSSGNQQSLSGTISDRIMKFSGEAIIGGELIRTQVTLISDGSRMSFVEQLSTDNGPWEVSGELTYLRIR